MFSILNFHQDSCSSILDHLEAYSFILWTS